MITRTPTSAVGFARPLEYLLLLDNSSHCHMTAYLPFWHNPQILNQQCHDAIITAYIPGMRHRIPFPLRYSILPYRRHTGSHACERIMEYGPASELFAQPGNLKVHVATIYISSVYSVAVRCNTAVIRHFVISDLIRKSATLQRDGKKNVWMRTNGRPTGPFQ